MPFWAAFVGGDSTARSPNLDAEATINLYRETLASADAAAGYGAQSGNAKRAMLVGTPGLKLLMTAGDSGCRGKYSIDGRNFSVIGRTLYEFDPVLLTTTFRGTVANDGKTVSLSSNGRGGEQLLIVAGGQVYVLKLTTNVFTGPIALPLTNAPVQADFLDTYFLLTEANSARIWFSNNSDGTVWNALNFFTRSDVNDNVVGLKVLGNRIWTFGSRQTEIFYDSGSATTPFVPYPGTAINEGASSPWAIAVVGDSLVWQVAGPLGQGKIVRAASSALQAVSTAETGFAFSGLSTIADAETLVYEQELHQHVAFTYPTADKTWVFDAKEGVWHQRAGWDTPTSTYHRWRARGCCSVGQQTIVGDYANGNIYQLDLETFSDNGTPLRRLRRAPYLSAENQWLFVDAFELGIQGGVGLSTGQGSAPSMELAVSRDGAHTWSLTRTATLGAMGKYGARAVWNRLGRARADRFVVEVTQSDPVRTIWGPGAWLRITPGSGNL